MDGNGIELTISMVNTNNRDLLKACIESVYETTKKVRFEIVVVDNASPDGSVEMVRENFPEVKIVQNDSRRGYGDSHNRALEVSEGEYFLVFNEDMIVLPSALDTMIEVIKKDKTIGALGCRTLRPDGTLSIPCSNFPNLSRDLFHCFLSRFFPKSRMCIKMNYLNYDEEQDVDVIVGCCMLIPREVINKVGLFDPQFFIYSEEFDVCKRIKNAGWRVHFTPKAEVIHYGGQSSKTMRLKMFIIFFESKLKYYVKHNGRFYALMDRLILLTRFALRFMGWGLMRFFQKDAQVAKENRNVYWKALLHFTGISKTPI